MKIVAQIDVVAPCTVEELMAAFTDVPKDASITIKTHDGDRNADWHTIEVTWTVEPKKVKPTPVYR